METTAPAICSICGYNDPHHAESCPSIVPLVLACAEHRPPGTSSRTDDSAIRRSCSTCGAPAKGYR